MSKASEDIRRESLLFPTPWSKLTVVCVNNSTQSISCLFSHGFRSQFFLLTLSSGSHFFVTCKHSCWVPWSIEIIAVFYILQLVIFRLLLIWSYFWHFVQTVTFNGTFISAASSFCYTYNKNAIICLSEAGHWTKKWFSFSGMICFLFSVLL